MPTTTRCGPQNQPQAADDLLGRDFGAEAPNCKWVADLAGVAVTGGFVDTALVSHCYADRIVLWAVAAPLRAELALDALEMALYSRRGHDLSGAGAPLRQGLSVHRHSLHRPAQPRRPGAVDGLHRRQLRLR
jgi:transposase InsO family protein